MSAAKQTVVLITGANTGIGFEMVKQLTKGYPDYLILLGSRDADRGQAAVSKVLSEALSSGTSVEQITIDVEDDKSITEAAKLVLSRYGRLDVLVNNAGISNDHEYRPGETSVRDVMTKGYNTNVFGAIQAFEAFKPLLEKSNNPRIVFMSSSVASFQLHHVPGMYPLYRSTKSALNMLVMTYAELYKEKGWKINACCPGLCKTNLTKWAEWGEPVGNGAINAINLITAGVDTVTGTFSDRHGPLAW